MSSPNGNSGATPPIGSSPGQGSVGNNQVPSSQGNQPQVIIDSGVSNKGFDYQDLIERMHKRIQENNELRDKFMQRFRPTGSFLDTKFAHMFTETRSLDSDTDEANKWIEKLKTGEQDPKKSSGLRSKAEAFLDDVNVFQSFKNNFIAALSGLANGASSLMSNKSKAEPKTDPKSSSSSPKP